MLKKIVETSLAVMKEYELFNSEIFHLSYITCIFLIALLQKTFHRQDHQENGPLKLNPVLSNAVQPATISNPWMNPAQ